MTTNFARVRQFHEKFDPAPLPLEKLLPQRLSFMLEEFNEVSEAMDDVLNAAGTGAQKAAMAQLVKELADLLYTTYGTLHQLGVNADAAFAEVHTSNMSKTPNAGGKATKGPTYQPAQMEQFV